MKFSISLFLLLFCSACDQGPSPEQLEAQRAQKAKAAEEQAARALAEKEEAALKAKKKAEEQARLAAEQTQEAAQKEAARWGLCCDSLAKIGFEQRSLPHAEAARFCSSFKKEKGLEKAADSEKSLTQIKELLQKEELPAPCSAL